MLNWAHRNISCPAGAPRSPAPPKGPTVSRSQGLKDPVSQGRRVSWSQGLRDSASQADLRVWPPPVRSPVALLSTQLMPPSSCERWSGLLAAVSLKPRQVGRPIFYSICFLYFLFVFFVRLCPRQKYGDISVYAGKVACSEIVPPSEVSPPSEVWRPIYKKKD